MKSSNNVDCMINFRVTAKQRKALCEMAAEQKVSVGEFVRRHLFGRDRLSRRVPVKLIEKFETMITEHELGGDEK